MPFINGGGGGGGGGSGTVTSVSSANDSLAVATATTTPALTVGAVNKLFTNNAPTASLAMNSQKLTGLATGSGAGDSLRYEQVFAAGAVPIADIADPTTGKVVGSASNAAAAVFPPGYEINYTQITSNVNIASTNEASGTTIISPGAIVFDGTAVILEFFAPTCNTTTIVGDAFVVSLFEGATQIGRLLLVSAPTTGTQFTEALYARYRFTPSAGSHTYTITAWTQATTGTPFIGAGAGGTGTALPAFCRFTKV